MTPDDILQNYQKLRNELREDQVRLPRLEKAGLQVHPPMAVQDADLLWQQVMDFAPDQGWLAFQSSVAWFFDKTSLARQGILLYGEVCRGQTDSLHIRQDGNGGWLLYPMTWMAKNGDLLMEVVSFKSMARTIDQLQYQVFWQREKDRGFVQRYSRFIGLTRRREESAP